MPILFGHVSNHRRCAGGGVIALPKVSAPADGMPLKAEAGSTRGSKVADRASAAAPEANPRPGVSESRLGCSSS